MQRFGEKLRRLRERRGMTQQQLADTFGFSDVYAHYLETGKKKPNVELLMRWRGMIWRWGRTIANNRYADSR